MGIEITVGSLEEMCELMCNNNLPKESNHEKGNRKDRHGLMDKDKEKGIEHEQGTVVGHSRVSR